MINAFPDRDRRECAVLAAQLVLADAHVREQRKREALGIPPGTAEDDARLHRGRVRYLLARAKWMIGGGGVDWLLLRGAISDHSRVLARFPECVSARVGRGEALLAFFGRERAALRDLDHALRHCPANDTALRARASTFMRLGVRSDPTGEGLEYALGLADADALVSAAPFDPEAHTLRANVRRARALAPRCTDSLRGSDFERAAADYERALQLGSDDLELLNQIVAMLAWCVRVTSMSEVSFELAARMRLAYVQALEQRVSTGDMHYSAGKAFAHVGWWREALGALSVAAIAFPHSRDISDDIARIEAHLEDQGDGL